MQYLFLLVNTHVFGKCYKSISSSSESSMYTQYSYVKWMCWTVPNVILANQLFWMIFCRWTLNDCCMPFGWWCLTKLSSVFPASTSIFCSWSGEAVTADRNFQPSTGWCSSWLSISYARNFSSTTATGRQRRQIIPVWWLTSVLRVQSNNWLLLQNISLIPW